MIAPIVSVSKGRPVHKSHASFPFGGMDVREFPKGRTVATFLRRGWLRAAVGTATAFVLALQMLLAGTFATQMAVAGPADPFVICYGNGHSQNGSDTQSDSTGTRIHHASCAICALASVAPPVADVLQSLVVFATTEALVLSQAAVPPRAGRHHDPRSSQGPPQAA
jgi:hypothetical protein